MSAESNPIVPVDVVQGIVQQLSTVSQHTTTATTAMRHLMAEIAGLRDMRQRDTTTMVEALAGAGVRSGSPGVLDGGGGICIYLLEVEASFREVDTRVMGEGEVGMVRGGRW